ncbi:MAG: 30S ribosomal protein S27ae [Candidatus Aenigmarchaeota archaeon]|nr:30S ribosomal protein S27ae [Candidatus Aenigmarchaeota archaeon]
MKQHEYFSVEDDAVKRNRKYCPRCGNSFLANHKNRLTCGKCTYVEFLKG